MPLDSRFFVSFSGRDSALAAKVLRALDRQQYPYWDYSRPGDEIPISEDIRQFLRSEIDRADYFIALITANSCAPAYGAYPRFETEYACTVRSATGRPVVIPLVARSLTAADLPTEYEALRAIRWLEVDTDDEAAADTAIREIANRFNLPFRPELSSDPRIRLIPKLREEIAAAGHEFTLTRADQVRLESLAEEFTEEASKPAPDWEDALATMIELCRLIQKRGLTARLYFPSIMKGLCELQCGRTLDARETFAGLANHPVPDMHASMGLALAFSALGEHRLALSAVNRAVVEGAKPPWELRFNLAVAALACGELADLDQALSGVDLDQLRPEDKLRVIITTGVIHFRKGALQKANAVLAHAFREREAAYPGDRGILAAWFGDAAASSGDAIGAAAMLESEAVALSCPDLMHRAAHILLRHDYAALALGSYEKLLAVFQDPGLHHLIGYARLLKTLGRESEMRRVCLRTIDAARAIGKTRVLSADDHFHCGFAHYLLGQKEIAANELLQSGELSSFRYADLQ